MKNLIKERDIKLINFKLLEKQCILAEKSKNKRVRVSLHNSTKEIIQESIIIASGFSYIPPHKHPKNKTESYHIIKGQLNIYLLNNNGKLIKSIFLGKNKNFYQIYKLSKPIFHLVVPRSKFTIWHEITQGPFIKNSKKFMDIAKFSPKKDSKHSVIKNYCNKLCGIDVDKLIK
jgi:glucose-6-phosphate isomerase